MQTMGTYTGTEANDIITPNGISAGVIADPLGTTPGAGPDTLIGNGGNDVLDGGAGADALSGGLGDDTYIVDDVGDVATEDDATATGGEDVVLSTVSFTLGAGIENLTLQGSAAIDGTGNELDNVLTGNSGDNVLNGGAGIDTLNGRGGLDNLIGGQGDDSLEGRGGDDRLVGGAGLDLLTGGGGGDTLRGGADDDTLDGIGGDDTLKGNQGLDKLDGGKGLDTLVGGGGDDEFIFAKPNQGGDLIRDFRDRDGNADSIVVDAAGFRGGLEAGVLADEQFQVSEGHDADSAEVRFILDTTDNTLWFDRNGDADGGLTLIADLQASANLQADDIVLV
jgi:Ca2+-binding RTX toxin-like protein